MPYNIPSFDEIRQRQLRDARNLDATAHTETDSDLYIRACATASASEGLYAYQAWQARQLIPDTADPEYLEQHCALRGITHKPATRATGTLIFTGRAGAVVPAGVQVKDADEVAFRSTEAATLTGDDNAATAVAACEAIQAGALPNRDAAPVTLIAAPSGVQSRALLTLEGGTNPETDADLLSRLLDYMRNPPSGGTKADYRRWAREVPGVTDAQVYPLRQGPGTVDVVITGADGIPGADVVQACQAHIDTERPLGAHATVYAPVLLSVDMTLALRVSGTATLQSLRGPVADALLAQFSALRPGDPLILARCIAAVSGLEGVVDVAIRDPTANPSPTALQWCRPGELTLEAL